MAGSTYEPGIYRTADGRFVTYSGGRWKEFYSDFRGLVQDSLYEPKTAWVPLTRISLNAADANEADVLNRVKQWWEKAAKREEADWAPLIELASILMQTKKGPEEDA